MPLSADAETSGSLAAKARPVDRALPTYPLAARRRGQEGWVEVSYVVLPDGTVAEPIVDAFSGIPEFERSASKAVEGWKFEPATRNGEPVKQCQTEVGLTFALKGGKRGARRSFRKGYSNAQKLIDEGDYRSAEKKVDEMSDEGKWNLYEYGRLNLLRAQIADEKGDIAGELKALRRIARNDGEFIEDDLYRSLLPLILQLEIQLGQYAQAMETYQTA